LYNTIILCASFLVLFFKTKNRENPLSMSLYFLYGVTFVCSILLEIFFFANKPITTDAAAYLWIILLLWIMPFNKIGFSSIRSTIYNYKVILILSKVFIILSLFTIIYFSFYFFKTIFSGDIVSAREDALANLDFVRGGLFMDLFSIVAHLYHVCLLLYFTALKDNWNPIIRNLLLVSSLSFPIHILSSFGRDGIVYWCLNFIILYFMFREVIVPHQLRVLKKSALIIACVMLLIITSMTYIRFGVSSSNVNIYDGNILHAALDYMGQQPGNFSSAFESEFRSAYSYFPTLRVIEVKVFGIGYMDDIDEDFITLTNLGMLKDYNVFGYFVKSLIWKSGKALTLLISFMYFMIVFGTKQIFRRKYKKLSLLIVLFTLFQIPMNGVFYLRQSVGSFDLAYLFLFMTCGYLVARKS
jgi:hypothetical protein